LATDKGNLEGEVLYGAIGAQYEEDEEKPNAIWWS
tara:strand:- start:3643 stop:3747 length:105 start_codon:yes stop_codon:yes gene_type:complete